jgi:hypothetical protein
VKKIFACEELPFHDVARVRHNEIQLRALHAPSSQSEIMTIKRPLIHAGFCNVTKIVRLRRSIRV